MISIAVTLAILALILFFWVLVGLDRRKLKKLKEEYKPNDRRNNTRIEDGKGLLHRGVPPEQPGSLQEATLNVGGELKFSDGESRSVLEDDGRSRFRKLFGIQE